MKFLFTTSFIILLTGCSSLPAEYKKQQSITYKISYAELDGATNQLNINPKETNSTDIFKDSIFNKYNKFISENNEYYLEISSAQIKSGISFLGNPFGRLSEEESQPYIKLRFCNLNPYFKFYGCDYTYMILKRENNKNFLSRDRNSYANWIETRREPKTIYFAWNGDISNGETRISIENSKITMECIGTKPEASSRCIPFFLFSTYLNENYNKPLKYTLSPISKDIADQITTNARLENNRWVANKKAQREQNFSAFMTGLNVALTEANQVMSERVSASQQSLDETMEIMAIQAAKEREQQNVAKTSSQQTSRTSNSSSSQNSTTDVNLPQRVITPNNQQANTKQLEEQRKKEAEQKQLALQKKQEEEKRKRELEKQKQEELKQVQEAKKKQELLAYNRAIRAGTRVGAISCGSKNQARIVGILGRAQRPSHVHTKCSLEEVRYRCPSESGWRYRSQDLWVLNNACIGVGDDVVVSNTNCPAEQLIVEPTRFTCDTN